MHNSTVQYEYPLQVNYIGQIITYPTTTTDIWSWIIWFTCYMHMMCYLTQSALTMMMIQPSLWTPLPPGQHESLSAPPPSPSSSLRASIHFWFHDIPSFTAGDNSFLLLLLAPCTSEMRWIAATAELIFQRWNEIHIWYEQFLL